MIPEPCFDEATASVRFTISLDGKAVVCHITEGWMYDQFGPMRLRWGLLEAYRRNARSIAAAAARRWRASGGDEPVWLVREAAARAGRAPAGQGSRKSADSAADPKELPSRAMGR